MLKHSPATTLNHQPDQNLKSAGSARLGKVLLTALSAATITLALTACNTFEGVGKDIEKAGQKIKDAAHSNK